MLRIELCQKFYDRMIVDLTLDELMSLIGVSDHRGGYSGKLRHIATLQDATAEDLAFLGNMKYTPQVAPSKAGVILVPSDFTATEPKAGQAYVPCENPSLAIGKVCAHLEAKHAAPAHSGIHPTAVIAPSASIDPTASIGPYCVVGDRTVIGAHTALVSHVTLGRDCALGAHNYLHTGVSCYDRSQLGDHVILHAGVVIGSDGFGYETENGQHIKIPQIGNVVIGDSVEIGANSTVDRARFGSTQIGAGTKIDNLVQIAHNVVLGKGCLVCAQAGISGSTTLGDYVILAGQAGVAGHLKLESGTIVGAQGGVNRDLKGGQMYRGTPAIEAAIANRADVLRKRLPELFRRVRQLETDCNK